jgi:hypothetical protein
LPVESWRIIKTLPTKASNKFCSWNLFGQFAIGIQRIHSRTNHFP